ncbi:hypothetical protein MVEG_04319 [Podila verticillata NRRL 6337]|nr:hypothetical protein MVEG_04319 [Podila verticillata NRRL 6337]
MTTSLVLDIHFLKEAICQDLSTRDIRRCMLVCRAWHTNFSPYLWRDITLRRRHTFKRFNLPETQAILERYAQNVRVVNNIFADIWPIFCKHPIHNLTVLKSPVVRRQNWTHKISNNYNRNIIALLEANPYLHTLELGHFSNASETLEDLLEAIQNHNSLQRVRIDHPRAALSSPMFGLVLLACLKLQSIFINIGVHGTYGQMEPTRYTFLRLASLLDETSPTTTLKELHFPGKIYPGDHYVFMSILALCPGLEQLTLPKMNYFDVTPTLASTIVAMPQLQHLNVRSANVPFIHLNEIIQACAGLTTFIAGDSPRSDHAEWTMVTELLHHHDTLEVLDLTGSRATGVTGAMMHAMLCVVPNLKEFVAMGPVVIKRKHGYCGDPILRVSDMEGAREGPAWVCRRLKVLRLRFENTDPCEGDVAASEEAQGDQNVRPAQLRIVPRALVDHLSKLTLLEDLRLGRVIPGNDQLGDQPTPVGHSPAEITSHRTNQESQALPQDKAITLSMALEALSSLQRLKRLELRNLKEFLDKPCLRNSRKQWKDIEWTQYS